MNGSGIIEFYLARQNASLIETGEMFTNYHFGVLKSSLPALGVAGAGRDRKLVKLTSLESSATQQTNK